jgi:hypothetical protein
MSARPARPAESMRSFTVIIPARRPDCRPKLLCIDDDSVVAPLIGGA